MDIIVGTPASIATPAAGYVTLFINTEANNQLYAKFSDGTVEPYSSTSSESASGIASAWLDGVMCALKKGTITATEYQSIVNSGLTIQTVTDASGNTTVSIGSRSGALSSITLNTSAVAKGTGTTHQITITWDPATVTNQSVSYVTSNATLATVDANGLVSCIAAGVVVITVIPLADPTKAKTVTITIS